MQKAAATAQEAGISFEWLGAYIATISENTRQAPEVIGSSLNSIMSRLQSIKKTGYNEEDETQINDIAKALSNIDVALMDTEGNWRNMTDIFMDIALQWEDLNDKTRSYIATTMAGTRQRNYFLTLMDDLKNVNSTTGEASRAMELYEGAMNSAGAAAEKYAVYQESVTAAHDSMTASLERLYSLFDSNILKGFYNLIGGVADGIYGLFDDSIYDADYTSTIAHFQDQATWIQTLRDEYVELEGIKDRTEAQDARMVAILDQLVSGNRNLASEIKTAEGGYVDAEAAVKAMNAELERNLGLFRQYSQYSLKDVINDTEALGTALDEWEAAEKAPDLWAIFEKAATGSGKDIFKLSAKDADKLVSYIEGAIYTNNYNGQELAGWQSEIYSYFYPDGERNDAIKDAWDVFLEDYKNNFLAGIHSLDVSTSDAAAAKVGNELKKKADYVIESISYTEAFANLPDKVQQEVFNMSEAIVAGIDQADWSQGEQYLTDKIISEAGRRVNAYVDLMTEAGKLEEKIAAQEAGTLGAEETAALASDIQFVLGLLNEYNELAGTSYYLPDILGLFKAPIEEVGNASGKAVDETAKLQEQIDALYAKIQESIAADTLQAKRDGGWADEVKEIGAALNEADPERLKALVENQAKLNAEDPDAFNAMVEDLDGFKEIMALFADGDITDADITKALELYTERVIVASQESGMAAEKIKALTDALASQELDALKESGFASWFEELSSLSASEDEAGLYNWFFGKDDGQMEAFIEAYPVLSEFLYTIQESGGTVEESTELWQQFIEKMAEARDEYAAWLEEYKSGLESDITDEEGMGLMDSLLTAYDTEGIEGYRDAWEEMNDEQRDWLIENTEAADEMLEVMEDNEDAVDDYGSAVKKMNRELKRMELDEIIKSGEAWEEVGEVVDDVENGNKDFMKSYQKLADRIEETTDAQGALDRVLGATDTTTQQYQDDIATLSDYCGFAIQSENDLALAQQYVAGQMNVAASSASWLLNYLYGICGSQFNSANWQAELQALAASGDVAAQAMWALIEDLVQLDGATVNFSNGTFSISNFGGSKKTGGGSGKSGGGGSGGKSPSSSSSSKKEMSEIEKMIDLMEQLQKLFEVRQNIYQLAQDYYEQTGELQGVILYYNKEKAALEENNKTLEENIAKLEKSMKAQEAKVAAMSRSSDKYQDEADDLEALQEAHQDYTEQLWENKTAILELAEAIEETKDDIREMEIELRDTIHEAIEDRNDLEEDMLDATVDIQEEIMDIITERYEKEHDLAVEAAEAKQEALEKEIDLLDEQLAKRKELSEEEDKAAELAKLEAEYQRISLDPTRQEEALKLQEKIADLREEMAWDLTEKEVESQKASLEDQIDNIDKYIESLDKYYDNLFENPDQIIAEMEEVMKLGSDGILEWLKNNSLDYASSTDAGKESMASEWEDTLREMSGEVETYWDEVEAIIAQGDEAIIEFLKANSADYKEAGKLQAEAYVDEWRKQLEDLKLAYKEVNGDIDEYEYATILPAQESSGGGSSGGSGSKKSSGGGGSKITIPSFPNEVYNPVTKQYAVEGDPKYDTIVDNAKKNNQNVLMKYALGGMADYTGLAWLDGSPSRPERILSPYQTELFESLLQSLHQIKVSIPKINAPAYGDSFGGSNFTFGDINIQVDSLNDDADLEKLSEAVMEHIVDAITDGAAVGGLRFTQ